MPRSAAVGRRARRRSDGGRSHRRSDLARANAQRAPPRRAGGARIARADAALRGTPVGASRCRRTLHPVVGAGSGIVGCNADRRGRARTRARRRRAATGTISAGGGDPVRTCGSARTGRTDWPAIATLYEGLVRIAPTLGAHVGRAAAVAEAHGAETGLALLGRIPAEGTPAISHTGRYRRICWFVRSNRCKAAEAYERAIGLCEDEAMRAFLIDRAARIRAN